MPRYFSCEPKVFAMIHIKNLKAGYDHHQVLFGVDLQVKPDEIVVLIGPNGAGKSTVIKSVFNLTTVYSGKIMFKGKDIGKLHTHDRIQLGIGYVPQGRQVFPNLSVRENLEMGAFLTRDKDLIEEILCIVLQDLVKVHIVNSLQL